MDNFISLSQLNVEQFSHILEMASKVKKYPGLHGECLEKKIIALLFQKPSLRTRVTFEVGILELGGRSIYLSPQDIQMGTRETPYDIAKNLERWVQGAVVRTFSHQNLHIMAETASIPIINALSDYLHPCQALADFLTLTEHKGDLSQTTLAYLGDGNNVCHSLILAAALAGTRIQVACPEGCEPAPAIVEEALKLGENTGFAYEIFHDAVSGVEGAHAVYTDVWTSMGQEEEMAVRQRIFAPFRVDEDLMAGAAPDAIFMHCLPTHRGEEVTDTVVDGDRSVVFDQAENRLHVQKAVMALMMGDEVVEDD